MVTYRGFHFDSSALGYFSANAFNSEDPKISDDERHYRVALIQLALKIDLRSDLKIDGQFGSDTQRDLIAFAKKNNCPASLTNPLTQLALLNVLAPR
jgi:hypothetical protein